MGTRIDYLFQEWGHFDAPVLFTGVTEIILPRNLEAVFAESTAYCRASGRLTWIVLDRLLQLIEGLDVEALLTETRKSGDLSVLGLLSEAAYQRRPNQKFIPLIRVGKPSKELIPFFHRVAKSPLATRLAQENGLELFRKWNYLCSELRYLSDELPLAE